jgi:GT2 family glycosyltransferase
MATRLGDCCGRGQVSESGLGGSAASSEESVALIILTLNQREATLRCLQSVMRLTGIPVRVLLWDNGSADGTTEAVRAQYPDVLVLRSESNLGVAGGRNAAAEAAIERWHPKHLFFMDNDMEIDPQCIRELAAAMQADPLIAQATGKIRILGREAELYGAGGCVLDFRHGKTGHVAHGEHDDGRFDRPGPCLPSGGCMMIRTEVFQALRGFDTIFNPYGPEDLDIGLRAREAGYSAVYVPSAVVFHEATPGHTGGGGMHSWKYVRRKARHWLILLHRHATLREQAYFYFIGGPALALFVAWRRVAGAFTASVNRRS